jgi:hypothetical protein
MLGIVFTEFLEMVEDGFGPDMVDDILDDCALSGAYTAVGNYPFSEMAALIGALSQRADQPAPALIEAYGQHLFGRFSARYPDFFCDQDDVLTFLEGIEKRIHTEVRKLYPSAELPTFICERPSTNILVMHYQSPKCLGYLAAGLIKGCGEHFKTPLTVAASADLSSPEITFTVQRT